jgi:hypothetical protein
MKILSFDFKGSGAISPNVTTLGADQFDEKYSKDRKEKESYFNWFIFFYYYYYFYFFNIFVN